ncbi:Gfo/Idh/MocA family protein [Natrarchaeobius sp. A-rgal3]|uniref:Gfo/Idh/MocA family protein n=1 Tax=Natrarchaeobius versutus TaxID=1679078 RepID=UPI00350EEA65
MDNAIRYGVVGCAGMGTNHADAIEEIDGATLVACADVDEGIARSFAETYDTAWYTDPAEMARDAELDAASVCTPNGTHLEIVTALAEAGVDVLCEKPLEITPERTNELVDVCERADVTAGCIFQRRTCGGPRLAREALADGRLGELVLGEVQVKWYREPSYYDDVGWHGTADVDGGILHTQALHGIDLLQWATGGIERVAAKSEARHHDIEVPDTVVVSVEFADGGYGQITGSTAVYPQEPITLRVHGTEGSIAWYEDELESFETIDGDDATAEPFHLGTGIPAQVRDFVEAIEENREPMVPLPEARKTNDVVFAIEAAIEREEWVDVAAVRDERSGP